MTAQNSCQSTPRPTRFCLAGRRMSAIGMSYKWECAPTPQWPMTTILLLLRMSASGDMMWPGGGKVLERNSRIERDVKLSQGNKCV